jgi:hypothetical protein
MRQIHKNDPVLYLLWVGTFVVLVWTVNSLVREWFNVYDN